MKMIRNSCYYDVCQNIEQLMNVYLAGSWVICSVASFGNLQLE